MAQESWRPQMTRRERTRGILFFALYFVVFPPLKMAIEWFLDDKFGLYLSAAVSSAVYYYIMTVLTMWVFWSFMEHGLDILKKHPKENAVAFLSGFAGAIVLDLLIHLLPWPMENPGHITWKAEYAYSPAATILIVVILMPVIEEVLFRGLLFGSVRRHNRVLAWILSVGLFMLYNVWPFAAVYGDLSYLIIALQYLPAALMLTWCYDRGGSIWSPVALHIVWNAVALSGVV